MSSSTLRSLTVEWEDPTPGLAAAATLPGLEYLRLMLAGEVPPAPIARLLDFTGDEVEEGRVVFRGRPGEQHYNPIGTVHGGFALTLLDSAMGCAVHTTLPAGVGYTSLEVKTNFVRPISRDTGEVLCEGRVVAPGRRVAVAEGRLTSAETGKLLATGTTTCLVFPLGG